MTAVHEEEAHHSVAGPFIIEQAIVEDDKGSGIYGASFV
jgi:hypothetical protein